MRLELTRSCDHYPLKVACIPISPPAPRCSLLANSYRKVARRTAPLKKPKHKFRFSVFSITIKDHSSAQNRTRTCTSLNTRTWNERVYQFRHLGFFNYELRIKNYECPYSLIVSTSPHIPNSNSKLRINTSKNYFAKKSRKQSCSLPWSGKRDSNSRPRPWQGRALPTELLPHYLKEHFVASFPKASAKVLLFFDMTKFFEEKMQKNCNIGHFCMLYGIFLLILQPISVGR